MSSEIYELMKRSDEGAVVEKAHRRPRFVEDCVREMIRGVVDALPRARRRHVRLRAPGEPRDDPPAQRAWPSASACSASCATSSPPASTPTHHVSHARVARRPRVTFASEGFTFRSRRGIDPGQGLTFGGSRSVGAASTIARLISASGRLMFVTPPVTKPAVAGGVARACLAFSSRSCSSSWRSPTAADAAAPWSAPTPIPGTGPSFPSLGVSGNGTAIAAWSEGGALGTGTPHLCRRVPACGRAFGAARELGRLSLTGLATYGSDRVVALGTTGNEHPRAAVVFGAHRRQLRHAPQRRAARRVARRRDRRRRRGRRRRARARLPGLFCERPTPYLIVRRHGSSFGRPIKLAPRTNTVFGAVAINARGDVLAVWERPLHGSTGTRGIYARERTADGRLGSTRRLGTSAPAPKISAALGDGRRAVVAWVSQRVSEGDAGSPAMIRAAIAAPGERFGPASRRLEVVEVTGTGRYVGQAGAAAVDLGAPSSADRLDRLPRRPLRRARSRGRRRHEAHRPHRWCPTPRRTPCSRMPATTPRAARPSRRPPGPARRRPGRAGVGRRRDARGRRARVRRARGRRRARPVRRGRAGGLPPGRQRRRRVAQLHAVRRRLVGARPLSVIVA